MKEIIREKRQNSKKKESAAEVLSKVECKIASLDPGTIFRLDGSNLETKMEVTMGTIMLLNKYGIRYRITTGSDRVCECMDILDKQLVHIQVNIPDRETRILVVAKLKAAGLEVTEYFYNKE